MVAEDGMDQSKWALPRVRHGQLTKALQKLERPRTKVQGCWAHNVALFCHVVEVRQPSDGSTVVESMLKTIEYAESILKDKMPKKILIWVPRQKCGAG